MAAELALVLRSGEHDADVLAIRRQRRLHR
jgi:hypothetical protein